MMFNLSSLQTSVKHSLDCRVAFLILLAMTLTLYSGGASAQSTYAPDFCNFSVTFPETPYMTERCEGEDSKRCYNLVSYTRVFNMNSTVNFRVICSPVSAELQAQYSPEVMQATLRAMTKQSVIKEYNTTFSDEGHYRMAGLVGEAKVGRTPTIYIAQLWIGDSSALSVEAELIGDIDAQADGMFSDVLRSIGHKKDLAEQVESNADTEGKAESDEATTPDAQSKTD